LIQEEIKILSKNVRIRKYTSIKFPVVLCGCETWSLSLREKHRLRVFKNGVLRRIFGPRRAEVVEGWRKVHNEELHDLYSWQRMMKSRRMRWAGNVVRMGEKRNRASQSQSHRAECKIPSAS
jgi:hypothetical protein